MPRISVLPDAVVDQIAAGVDIAIEDGGRQRIRVADDGTGMARDDALLALARHATSKIKDTADLVGVRSFGFRGEALPAIASVAELEIETAPEGGAGTHLRAVGGELRDVRDAARRRGTTVIVSRLFFNAPARRRFL